MNRTKTIASFAFVAISAALACTPAEMAAVYKIDPVSNPKFCPMQCGPTAGVPTGGCCEDGNQETDGYMCNNPQSTSKAICYWAGPVGPASSDVPMMDKARDAGVLVPTTAPSPVEPPKEVTETRAPGKG